MRQGAMADICWCQHPVVVVLALWLSGLVGVRASATQEPGSHRGVALERGVASIDLKVYKNASFECDGKRLPRSVINDDYCDCPVTGLDEPGTSACSRSGLFFCHDKYIPSSRVDDGVCDCCDGTDEDLSVRKCPDTCAEHDELVNHAKELNRRGSAIQAKRLDEERVERLQLEKDVAEERRVQDAMQGGIDRIKKTIDKFQEVEKTLNNLDGGFEETLNLLRGQMENLTAILDRLSSSQLGDSDAIKEAVDAYQALRPALLSQQKLANTLLSDSEIKDLMQPKSIVDRFFAFFSSPSFDVHVMRTRLTTHLAALTKERQGLEKSLTAQPKKIKELTNQLEMPTRGFMALKGKCFSTEPVGDGYGYEVCLLEKAWQTEVVGKGKDRKRKAVLGKWGTWKEDYHGNVWVVLANGDKCWNGITRSLSLRMVCSEAERLVSVSEPSQCVYEGVFESPAGCKDLAAGEAKDTPSRFQRTND